jgi:YYY domain-containing protein
MFELLQMWALVELLGIISLPLTITVFHNLSDRGWAFSKAIGMATLAFCVWLPLMYVHALPFNRLFIAGMLLIVLAFSLIGFVRTRQSIIKLIRVNFIYIIATEIVFLGMMFLLGWIRSYVPQIYSFEMYMDEGFIAAIMRSPHLPPSDMWLSGYSINYYYYAHFTIAVLAKLIGQSPSIAFNTGICTFYGLTAVNLFGVTCNVVSWARHRRAGANSTGDITTGRPDTIHPPLLKAIPYGFLTILMAQVLGNLAATQQWWRNHGDSAQFDWFYQPTRVIDRTINEFPAFSFLLSCFHAHVLALAFTIVAIALALNLFLEQDGKGLFVYGRGWRLPLTLGVTALIIGGLFTMNGWDLPTYLSLAIVCIALQQWLAHDSRFSVELVLDTFIACANVCALSFLLYVPFYLNFISPSEGIGIVGPADRSPLGDEVLIYGMFAFVFISLLLASALKHRRSARPSSGESAPASGDAPVAISRWRTRLGVLSLLLVVAIELAAFGLIRNSITLMVTGIIAVLGAASVLYHLRDRPRAFILLLGTVAFALVAGCELFFLKDVFAGNYPRMNTVFKFYFQAWALLSISCGAGVYFILESFRPAAALSKVQRQLEDGSEIVAEEVKNVAATPPPGESNVSGREPGRGLRLPLGGILWGAALLVFLLAGAVYPLVGTYARTNHYAQRTNSLDGLAYLQTCNPSTPPYCDYDTHGDYEAIRWLNTHVTGNPVIVEAVGPDYSSYARISAFTGLPTLMGWVGHEYQWRVNWLNNGANAIDFTRRAGDVDSIYTDPDPAVVLSLMARYHAQYLYVGLLERVKYPTANLQRFSAFMKVVYSADGVTIYMVR